MKNDEGRMMKDDDFKLFRGFGDGRTNGRTDICDCRVAFATENSKYYNFLIFRLFEMLEYILTFFSRKSDSTITNVCSSVHSSVRLS